MNSSQPGSQPQSPTAPKGIKGGLPVWAWLLIAGAVLALVLIEITVVVISTPQNEPDTNLPRPTIPVITTTVTTAAGISGNSSYISGTIGFVSSPAVSPFAEITTPRVIAPAAAQPV